MKKKLYRVCPTQPSRVDFLIGKVNNVPIIRNKNYFKISDQTEIFGLIKSSY